MSPTTSPHHRTTTIQRLILLWTFFFHGAVAVQECQRATAALLANHSDELTEAFPSNITCTFINDTYCAVDLSNRIQDFKGQCYAANGRIILWDSTAQCNSTTLGPATTTYSIFNDPICMSSICSLDQASEAYNLTDRYEDLGIDSDDCYQYTYLARWNTTLSGRCAAETELLSSSSSSLLAPALEEECVVSSDHCVHNYTATADVYYLHCREMGGAPYRQPERTLTCLDSNGNQRLHYTQVNIPLCFGVHCSADAVAEEEQFVNQQWMDRWNTEIFKEPSLYASCTFQYTHWEAVPKDPANPASDGRSVHHAGMQWRWTALFYVLLWYGRT